MPIKSLRNAEDTISPIIIVEEVVPSPAYLFVLLTDFFINSLTAF